MNWRALEATCPDIVRAMRKEDDEARRAGYSCEANWSCDRDHEMPILLSEFLHKDSLGQVMDEGPQLAPV
jgi:hypothetical protein